MSINLSSPSHVSRRFRNQQQQSYQHAMKNIRENAYLQKKDEEKLKIQAGEITIYREYRVGDFPDIQIKNFDIIRPLQGLLKVAYVSLLTRIVSHGEKNIFQMFLLLKEKGESKLGLWESR